MRIFKYRLQPGKSAVQVPAGTRFRSVGWQGEQLVIWAEVPDADVSTVAVATLEAVMTGGEVPPDADFIGTAQHPTMLDGVPFVVHVYLHH